MILQWPVCCNRSSQSCSCEGHNGKISLLHVSSSFVLIIFLVSFLIFAIYAMQSLSTWSSQLKRINSHENHISFLWGLKCLCWTDDPFHVMGINT